MMAVTTASKQTRGRAEDSANDSRHRRRRTLKKTLSSIEHFETGSRFDGDPVATHRLDFSPEVHVVGVDARSLRKAVIVVSDLRTSR